MKAVVFTVAMAVLFLSGCSQQMTNPADQSLPHSQQVVTTQAVQPSPDIVVDGGLQNLYRTLKARGKNVALMPIDGYFNTPERGYFQFVEGNDVRHDEVIHEGANVVRFRGGVRQVMDIESFLDGVKGDHFIIDYDPR